MMNLEASLSAITNSIRETLQSPNDLTVREFALSGSSTRCAVVFLCGITDKDLIYRFVIHPLQHEEIPPKGPIMQTLVDRFISIGEINTVKTFPDLVNSVLVGDTVVLIDGIPHALVINCRAWEKRGLEPPITEDVIRGPKVGFVEDIATNKMLIRRELRDPKLRFQSYIMGQRSQKEVTLIYIEDIINPYIVKELNRRLQSIKTDMILDSGKIEQLLEENTLSPFPQFLNTERPDRAIAALAKGKAIILVDGSPFAILAPMVIVDIFQSPEDYYERWIMATLLRGLRMLAGLMAVLFPAVYIALVSYHQGLIPSNLAYSIAGAREGVPFPAYIETIIMTLTMELIREAGLRLPKQIGQTVGIVGGLVIGEAAVNAGIVNPFMVIVTAITAIATFSLPVYSITITFRFLLFAFILAATIFGLYGIILALIALAIHITNLKSVGIPYSTPLAPTFYKDWKAEVARLPKAMLQTRPDYLQTKDQIRSKERK
ncbi:spore germination protein [Bacillus cytotoxicus]|uniref:GerA spore germination protein n=1 Tax=Bacillus cytotoxicus (strain DSM 22905 / CIP 110041 / 391-98 / NVH 391-98) TaxID=315749 RepID=A7GLD7_BACCN|nr:MULTISPECIES: spore germination protein [Bacillus cereus group]ABS20945.1 GerA spore germination protein [Bacillus cytotoxicus NVH 391-98]AWC27584.1 spore germination protein [Bacillus cytotoxicus]AWC31590.1 spore germination protein [Bacillus cytotoxicus]AWC35630.1 spore germination protein [Bacillus cytotoxicus]AWC41041.1 spore germination protein [Bacillus cytotoxicus]